MDIVAHGLWAGLGVRWLLQRGLVSAKNAVLAVGLSLLPDVVHLVPVALWASFGSGSIGQLLAYATATPGGEPPLPLWVELWGHHLHCTMHSAIIAGAVTCALWRWRSGIWPAFAGWWLHIVIDVFTHSAAFYPVAVLYPITYLGFDGIAWNTPWFMVANYSALLLGWLAIRSTHHGQVPRGPGRRRQ